MVDYGPPLQQSVNGLIVPKEEKLALNYWVYVDVFLNTLWLALVCTLAVLMVAFVVVEQNSLYSLHEPVCELNLKPSLLHLML